MLTIEGEFLPSPDGARLLPLLGQPASLTGMSSHVFNVSEPVV